MIGINVLAYYTWYIKWYIKKFIQEYEKCNL